MDMSGLPLFNKSIHSAMKRIRFILAGFLVFTLPLAITNAQEKKIKVIVEEDSGKKVLIDTVFSNSNPVDSLKLKDGGMVYMGRHRVRLKDSHPVKEKYVVVTVQGDENPDRELSEIEEIDSDTVCNPEMTGKSRHEVFIYNNSDDRDEKAEIKDTDKTRFVIAKNGIVVSIEGDDEAKVQELAREIEMKLDTAKSTQQLKDGEKAADKKPSEKK